MIKRFLLCFAVLFCSGAVYSLTPTVDYNNYYRFPFSAGFEYQGLSPFADYASTYNVFDLSVNVKYPLPDNSLIQPAASIGMMSFDNQDLEHPLKWDHTHYYLKLGADYSYRFSRNFEISGEILAGISEAVFPDLLPETGTVGTVNMLFEAGVRIGLDPSYNLSIDIHPNLRYLHSFSDLDIFNGFIMGVGFSVSYRFGDDPDAPQAEVRSIKFGKPEIPNLFAAMQSYYVSHSLGSISITNTEKYAIHDISVSFYQAGFMDTPTPAASIPSLNPGETVKVPIFASFNREVFKTEGITPLTGEIIAEYKSRGKPATQKISVTYDLYDKTSVVWDDDRKAAAFITPADSALRNYASFIRQSCRKSVVPAYPKEIQEAMEVFYALGEIGCLYQVDPSLPFTKVQGDLMVVDSISLPRNTLRNITGDCDDLTVLYCSMLEAVGIDTAFITVPGHIYAAFNTKVPVRNYSRVYPDRRMIISVDGEIWLPVEITLIGLTSFTESWRKGIDEWDSYGGTPGKRAFYKTRESQKLYRPVGLTEKDMGLQYGSGKKIDSDFSGELDKIISRLLDKQTAAAKEAGDSRSYNRLGIEFAKYSRLDKAEEAFNQALRLNQGNISATINLGNVLYLKENFKAAESKFSGLYRDLERAGRGNSSTAFKVLINLSRTNYALEEYDKADEYFLKAKSVDPAASKDYEYLSSGAGNGSGRGSAVMSGKGGILFAGETEEGE